MSNSTTDGDNTVINLPQWKALEDAYARISNTTLRELFAADPERASRMTFDAAGLHVDLSKNLVDQDTIDKLIALAEACNLAESRE